MMIVFILAQSRCWDDTLSGISKHLQLGNPQVELEQFDVMTMKLGQAQFQ